MNIKVAFYRGHGNTVNRIVRWWTKSPYSHAELIMPDGVTWIGISPKGSRLTSRIRETYIPTEWDFIELEVTTEQIAVIKEFFSATENCLYDWTGMILSQFLPFHIKRKGKWYCSEWIAYALRIACIIDWKIIKIYSRKDLSPGVLYAIVQRINEEETKEI